MDLRFGGLVSLFLLPSLFFHNGNICLVIAFAMTTPVPPCPMQTVATTAHLLLQFDGCFRPPRDPGFPTIPQRMAVCAACIGKLPNCNNKNNEQNSSSNCEDEGDEKKSGPHNEREPTVTPFSVGAMKLDVSTETTSQHAEYEGLLMGLEWLIEFISCPDGVKKIVLDEDSNVGEDGDAEKLTKLGQKARVLITIEGDCKTVIDQLNGKSIPRKLESSYRRAEMLLDKLVSTPIVITDGGMDSNMDLQWSVEYRLIPRSQNSISDSICNNLMNIISAESWMGSIHRLEEAENQIVEQRHLPSRVPTAILCLSKVFETAVRTIKYSLRPPLYNIVADIAAKTEDNKLLIDIGERLVEESPYYKVDPNSRPRREGGGQGHRDSSGSRAVPVKMTEQTTTSIKRTGVNYLIRGWEGLGNEKKVRFLKRKHCRMLSHCDDFDSDTGIHDENDVKDGRTPPVSESTNSRHNSYQELKNLGDVTKGEWDALIPDLWKPILDKWFVSAKYKQVNAVGEDKSSPVWVEVT